jgi:hypothetical protein
MKHCFICRKPIRFWQRRLITYDISTIKACIHRRCWTLELTGQNIRKRRERVRLVARFPK